MNLEKVIGEAIQESFDTDSQKDIYEIWKSLYEIGSLVEFYYGGMMGSDLILQKISKTTVIAGKLVDKGETKWTLKVSLLNGWKGK